MKAYWGVDVQIRVSLISALVGGERSVSRPGHFTSGEKAPCTDWIGSWAGLRTCLDDVERTKILPLLGHELRPLCRAARNQSLYRLHYPDCFWVSHAMFKENPTKDSGVSKCEGQAETRCAGDFLRLSHKHASRYISSLRSLFWKNNRRLMISPCCLYVTSPNVPSKRLGTHGNEYTLNNRRNVGCGVLYEIRVV
jgi:hypothetical protein